MHRLSQQSHLAPGGTALSRLLFLATLLAAAVVPIACTGNTPTAAPTTAASVAPTPTAASPTPAATVSATPTAAASATPTGKASPTGAAPTDYPVGSAIVTFSVGDEEFRVLVTDPANVAIATQLLAGEQAPSIPNGVIVRGDPDVNTGWTWHLDPTTFEFADMTTEVCDGIPSYVEDGSLTSDRFCPWSAKVEAVQPAPR